MNVTNTGLFAGLLLGVAAAAGGWVDLGELMRGRNRG